ncbi:hypothetical protein PAXRUDRAFT_157859 [Paxillus rubicundulus Ve08.2h10]|uniref:CxC1-like cysteine cluster associated with KDZ transposases domain-containing protein n=1 Tax=Paxillus rubicundulus Ve08.2h10 TaxID=930991 RepID=A0A0D0CDD4_9AGAM|nr:hypothetical protein PAXRUDRAFT_157859 [Paxillus rubicundulus Ve08.2h10]
MVITSIHSELTCLSEVLQQHNELANVSLIHVGLLGCSPTFPTTAIMLQCLELYHQLRRRQSSFSIQAFAKALCSLHNITYVPTFHDQFTMAFDAYLAILREVQTRVDVSLGQSDPNWHLRYGCPACTFKQEDEPPLHPASLKSMDGNNSAKRMANAGYADQRVFQSRYMISPSQVDVFKDDVQLRPGARQQSDSDPASCTDNWKAANSTDENTIRVFEQTGIFLAACRHGMVQTIAEMRHSGELAKYPLATINKLLDMCGNNQAIGTDIGCQLSKTVAASSLCHKAKQCDLRLAVNAFHGHAHNRRCQL